MCGIIAAISNKNIKNTLIKGLIKLEYRGYDSSGLAIINNENKFIRFRSQGPVANLIVKIRQKKHCNLNGHIGIAHTRWATHGPAIKINSHPHISNNISVVHNGTIENYKIIKKKLSKKGYIFVSNTDTEVIAHLIHYKYEKNHQNLLTTVQNAITYLKGSYSMVIMDYNNPTTLIAVRSGSPLLIGVGDQENFFTSDQLALYAITQKFIFLNEGDIAILTNKKIKIFNKRKILTKRSIINTANIQQEHTKKKYFKHYMYKEINEQFFIINKIINQTLLPNKNKKFLFSEFNSNVYQLLSIIEHITIIACGTSYNAGMISKYWFESLGMIPCDVEIASEFCYRKFIVKKNNLLIILSQSGETADSLAALRVSKKFKYLGSLAICNSPNSSLVHESDFSILTQAGIEIGVASTKSFTAQLTILLILTIQLMNVRKNNTCFVKKLLTDLNTLPYAIKNFLKLKNKIFNLAKQLFKNKHIIFIGRGIYYPLAIEGALKLKEISYIHSEAYAAGELKHGPLALIDCNTAVIVIAPSNSLIEKIKLNISEIQTRKGKVYVLSDNKTTFDSNLNTIKFPYIKELISPIVFSIPLQLLAYYIGLLKGRNIDKPRNLAKSVTVE